MNPASGTAAHRTRATMPAMRLLVAALFLAALPATAQELHSDWFMDGTTRFQGKIQDVFPYDLDGDGKSDLLATHESFDHDGGKTATRYISVKFQTPGAPLDGKPDQTWIVPSEAATLIFGNFTDAPGNEIGYLCADGAWVWEQRARKYDMTAKRLLLTETFFDLPQEDSLPIWMWPPDIDGNGMTDMLIPQSDAYRLYVQTKPGVYGRAFTLAMPSVSEAPEGGAAWMRVVKSLPRVEFQDVDGDFKQDVCLIWHDRFVYYLQGVEKDAAGANRMTFAKQPSGEIQLQFLQQRERKDQISTAFTYLKDLNRTGGVDFIASYTRGELSKLDSVATDYYMYLGNRGQAQLSQSPNWRISLPGISLNPQVGDLNGDGFDDIAVSSFETNMLSNAGKAVFQKVAVDYLLYLFNKDKQSFSGEYDYKETVYVDIDKMNKGGGMPQLRFNGDFDGDGRKDILRLDSDGWLSAAKGITVNTILKKAPVDFDKTDLFKFNIDDKGSDGKVNAPDGIDVWEVNGDGKADLVFRWSDRVKVLISR
ncbi:MAG: hypothetical protein K8T20_02250 [Planctomycetes bacterium]|nr:hypothetical protein [Planctomycetota bacterium]